MKKLLDATDIGGRIERDWLHFDADGQETITTEIVQDVEPLLDRNKAEYNDAPQRFGNGFMHKIATVDFTTVEQLSKLHRIPIDELMAMKSDHSKKIWNQFLNDSETRAYRTRPGRIVI